MSLGRNLKCSGCQRLWKKLIRGDNVIGRMFVLKVFFPKTALVWVIHAAQSGRCLWLFWLTMFNVMQCSNQSNCGVSYPYFPLSFISFWFIRGFWYENRSIYKRMYACRVWVCLSKFSEKILKWHVLRRSWCIEQTSLGESRVSCGHRNEREG